MILDITSSVQKVVGTFHIENVSLYWIWAFVFAIIVRLIISFMKTVEERYESKRRRSLIMNYYGQYPNEGVCFGQVFWMILRGWGENPALTDFGYLFILGVIELLSYPILMITHQFAFIGAWIGFKTVAHWGPWKEKRYPLNRFLIGNALILLLSLCIIHLGGVSDP